MMSPRARTLLLAYPLIEILLAVGVASLIGWGWTILLLLIGIPIGLGIASSAGREAFTRVRLGEHADAGDHAARVIAGLVIALPGFATDVIGTLLLIPAVRRFLGARLGITTLASGTIVQGTVVRDTVVRETVVHPPIESP